ncbi:43773_t:CDS:2 [Gigaspora margarita]|uniref:43773_t:CDS:1 n=1 Tax=Gigaspora margarita TaxID=4874 RepID=A0ABN7UI61_GIGMA|nr:43773_t:CDS:2 [Gigaspora margarita]
MAKMTIIIELLLENPEINDNTNESENSNLGGSDSGYSDLEGFVPTYSDSTKNSMQDIINISDTESIESSRLTVQQKEKWRAHSIESPELAREVSIELQKTIEITVQITIIILAQAKNPFQIFVVVEKQTAVPNCVPVGKTTQCAQEDVVVSYADNAKIFNLIEYYIIEYI